MCMQWRIVCEASATFRGAAFGSTALASFAGESDFLLVQNKSLFKYVDDLNYRPTERRKKEKKKKKKNAGESA